MTPKEKLVKDLLVKRDEMIDRLAGLGDAQLRLVESGFGSLEHVETFGFDDLKRLNKVILSTQSVMLTNLKEAALKLLYDSPKGMGNSEVVEELMGDGFSKTDIYAALDALETSKKIKRKGGPNWSEVTWSLIS